MNEDFICWGQEYPYVETRPHPRLDGGVAILDVFRSRCAECAAPFEWMTPARNKKRGPSRRCQDFKKPGVRVRSLTE